MLWHQWRRAKAIRKAKAKPSLEMIAFPRSKRKRIKELNASHSPRRAEAVAQLDELELGGLEDMGIL